MKQLLSILGGSRLEARVRLNMKRIRALAGLTALMVVGLTPATRAASEEGVALAIIYDTSGSMKDPVPDQSGGSTPKYVIANRALVKVAKQVQAFATKSAAGSPRRIDTGLFVFHDSGAREAIKFGPFDAAALQNWAMHFSNPHGN